MVKEMLSSHCTILSSISDACERDESRECVAFVGIGHTLLCVLVM